MLRQIRFLLCCAGTMLIFQTNQEWLFYGAALTAFSNLFSAQMMCGMQGCHTTHTPLLQRSPITLFHYGTTLVGILFCLLGSYKLAIFPNM